MPSEALKGGARSAKTAKGAGVSPAGLMRELPNHEVVTLAVYLLGGDREPVDTEDVAKKANEIAPGRFTWRKYKDQINLEVVRVYLSDAKKKAKGQYLIGSGNAGWTLSQAGLEFARAHADNVAELQTGAPRKNVGQDRLRVQRERARLVASDAFAKVVSGHANELTRRDAESFFRIDSYVQGEARRRRIATIANAHGDDPELGPVIELLAAMIKENNDGT
jgi:hypothetical protein